MFRDFSDYRSRSPDRDQWRSGLRLPVIFVLFFLTMLTAACQRPTNTALTGEEYPHPGIPSTGGVTTVTPAVVKSAAKAVSATEDTVLTLSNTTVTIPAGAILEDSVASLSSYGGTFINTSSIILQSEPVLLVISGSDGNDLPRSKIHKDIVVDVVSGKRASPTKLAMLFHEGGGLADAVKTGISQTVLAPMLGLVSGSTYKATFQMRPPRVAIVMAQTGGSLPTGYEDFKLPPVEVTNLAGSPDTPADVTLTWKSDANRNQGFAMVYAKAAAVGDVCTLDDLIEPDYDTATEVYSYSVTGLDDNSEYTFKVCSSSFRDPVDLSAGESVSVTTPKRALAVLSNTPADPTNATALNVTVGGENLTYYRYALLSGAADCSSATYSSLITVATPITNTLSGDGERLLCVLGRIDPSNDQLVPTTHAFTVDHTPPSFTSIALINDVSASSQTAINLAEKNNTTAIVGNLLASGYDSVGYSVTQASCTSALTYLSSVPTNHTVINGPEATNWRVCIKLSDLAGNSIYRSTQTTFRVDWTPPTFVSLPFVNTTVSDGYINNAEQTSNGLAVVSAATPTGSSNYSYDDFAIVPSATVCDASVNYSLTSPPAANQSGFSVDGLYRVCVRLRDIAYNATYGSSSLITVKKSMPSFTALDRGADVVDGFLSAAESLLANPLAVDLIGSNYDTAQYAVVISATDCQTVAEEFYGSIPLTNDPTINSQNEAYKVCVKLSDLAANPPAYGETTSFTALIESPSCSDVPFAHDALDGFINSLEHLTTNDLTSGVNSPSVSVVTSRFAVISGSALCDGSYVFSPATPRSNDSALAVSGTYKICAQVTDSSSQHGYCESFTIQADTDSIVFTSIDRINAVADGYINAADHATTSAIVGNLVGANYDTAKYAVVTAATICDGNVTYAPSEPLADSLDLAVDGEAYRVCVELSDVAGNPKAYGSSATFTLDVTAPTFSSVGFVDTASDNYLNAAEHVLTSDILGPVSGSGYSTEEFSVVPSTTTCGVPLSWSTPSPKANDSGFVSDGSYKVCVQITDDAGNLSHGESGVLVFDATSPVFTSIALSNEASDAYINVADTASSLDVVGSLMASGQTSEKYLVTTDASVCSAQPGYGASVPAGADFSSLNGDYKVCVELSDLAGNTVFGSSSVIHVDTTPPSFTSVALGADVSDGYMSIAEHAATTALAGSLVASGQDSADYAVVTSATTCNASVTYGVMPLANDASVSVHEESYKVCVKLTDAAGNPADYGASSSFTALLTAPSCASVALTNAASDNYISGTEHATSLVVTSGVTGGSSTVSSTQYAVIASAATCNSSQTFSSSVPKADDSVFGVNGTYKVCSKVADAADQAGYCESTAVTVVNNTITFTSIDLSGPASDGYINTTEHASSTAIVANLVGINYDTAKYAVVTSATTCNASVTYGSAVPGANSSDISSDGASYKVCVELSDTAGNPKAYGASLTFVYDNTAPSFTSLPLANAASDGYINNAEHALTTDVAGPLSASGQSAAQYALVTSSTTCAFPLSWVSGIPKANDALFTSVGNYKVCVQLTDVAGNTTYDNSPDIAYDNVAPVFTSIALANTAADTYVNSADSGSVLAVVVSLSATGQSSTNYKVATSAATCSTESSYNSVVPVGSDFSGLNGDYKVCVELLDAAGNSAYGSSSVIHVDTTPPSFTSLALGADVSDGYLSISEHAATTALAGSLVASGQDSAEYAVVTAATTCNASVTYGVMPLANDASVSVHEESYKVCVQLTDVAGNPAAYGAASSFTALLTNPSCSSVALINAASDNYISGTEHSVSLAVTSGVTGGSSTVSSTQYAVISSTATCNASQTFSSSVPKADDSVFGVNGTYKVCSKVADAASQAGYCESTAVTVVNNTITFTSIDLSGPATDGYINTTEHASSTAIVANLVGTNYDTAQYAVVTAATTCNGSVTYGASVPGANSSDISADGTSYKVCVELSDTAGNPKAYGASSSFTYDNTAPSFSSLPLANAAGDGYINSTEHALTTDVAGPLSSSGQSNIQYALVTSSTTCGFPLSWVSGIPKANDALFTSVGNYKVCVQLTDVAGNTTYDNSPDIAYDNVAPVFTSIALANTALDTYVNLADSSSGLDVVGSLSASGQMSEKYLVTTDSSVCSAQAGYGAGIPTGADFSSLNGDYKVCLELSDLAGNTAYGSSSVIHVDTTPPSFTSLAQGASVSDGYLSIAEHAATTALAGSLVASGQDSAEYAVVTAASNCDASITYGVMPLGNDSSVSAHEESYKVCVKLTDVAGNPAAYGTSSSFTSLLTNPSCSSVALINAASDNYISGTEHAASLAVTSGVTGGSSTVSSTQYVVISSAATCNGSQTFSSSVPKADDAIFGVNGTYKVCSKVVDAASQAGYCESSAVTVVNNTITFTSIDLSGPASDGYINTTEHSSSTAIAANLVGTNYDTAKYAVVTSATTCNASVTYGSAVPAANSSDISADGTSYKVCVELSDTAGNPKAYGASSSFVYDNTAPSFTSLPLANAAGDGYINSTEHALTTDVAGPLSSSGQSNIQYALVTSSTTCGFPLSWVSGIPKANDALFTSVGNYKVCVQLTDVAGNTTYDNSPDIAYDNVAPEFTSISLANTALDTYVNLADSGSALAVVGSLSATGQSSTNYKVATNAATCSSESSYGASMPTGTAFSGLNGDYKVCVELSDLAGNTAYGSSSVIHVDTTPPSFTSVALAGDALDLFINSSESATTNALVSAAVGTGHDAIHYSLVTNVTSCSAASGWSLSIPQSNSNAFSAVDSYKVCVRFSDLANNPDAFGASSTIAFDNVAPSFTSLALAGDALDGYLSQSERSNSTTILGTLTASGYTSANYKMILSSTTCDASLTYGSSINSNTADVTTDGSYKVCVKLLDAAGNATFGASTSVAVDTDLPVFSSLALGAAVADGYLSLAEKTAATSLGGSLVSSGGSVYAYAVVTAVTTCNASVTYGGMPNSDNAALVTAATYKLCAKVADSSGNAVYGASASFVTDFLAPSISAVTLAGSLIDGYLNVADQTAASALLASVTATNHDSLAYAVVAAATTCNSSLTYASSAPKTDSASFTADGSWKVCVQASDSAGNPPAYSTSSSFARDVVRPTSTVSTSGSINASTTAGNTTVMTGTASDSSSGLSSVVVSLQEGTGSCFDPAASDFTATCPNWLAVSGSSSWSYTIDDNSLIKGQTYTVIAKATDNAGNDQTSFGSSTFSYTASEGSSLWSADVTYDGASGDDRALAGAVDSGGNLYVVGYHTSGDKNWLIKKFSRRGVEDTTNWNKDVGDAGVDDIARSVAVDSSDNVYVVGSRYNGADYDWMIKKYSSSGVEDQANWDMLINSGNGNDEALGVATDSAGNVYVVGYGRNIAGISSGEDVWVKKFQSNGSLVCEQKLDEGGGNLADRATAIAVNNTSSKIYVTGYKTATGPDQRLFVKRLRMSDCSIEASATGNSSGSADSAAAIKLDSTGAVYVSGLNSSNQDWWIQKYTSALALSVDYNPNLSFTNAAQAIGIDSSNRIYVGGYKTMSGAPNSQDAWLRQFNSSLVENTGSWNKTFDGASSNDQVTAVVVTSGSIDTDNVYMIGWSTNLVGGSSSGDWWIKKLAGP